ncbi:MAG: HAD family hydrolase [Bacillota bacterium]
MSILEGNGQEWVELLFLFFFEGVGKVINIEIPGRGMLLLEYLVLDFNGTIAQDGKLLPGVKEKINSLSQSLETYILTADTFGKCREECLGINAQLKVLDRASGTSEKEDFIVSLGAKTVVTVGNGSNDCMMLAKSALGIGVIGNEGASMKALSQADVVVKDIHDALDLLIKPQRLVATLRE